MRRPRGPAAAFAVLAIFLCAVIVVPAPAAAQAITGAITGTVKDQSGGAIPGAAVVVRNVGTNATLELLTDRTGVYVAPLLSVGDYEVSVELQGFKKFVRSGLRVSVNDRLRIDVTLETGAIQETITVVAESPVVKTETSEISTLINQTQIAAMPLNGRSIIQLVAMQPGVSSNLSSTMFPGLLSTTVNVFVNGGRASQNSWMIDGADNTDVGSNLGLINFVNVDAVEEVKILRSNYNAEFGRSGGGQINVVTKSGTNQFRGSGFLFLRDEAWDASPFFGTYDPDKNGRKNASPVDYKNYGYTIGGPIAKNKLFFFWGNEYRNIKLVRGGGVQNTRTPTQRQRTGDFTEFAVTIVDPLTGLPFPGNVIPPDRIDPLAKALFSRFPPPNADPNVLGGNRNYSAVTQTKLDFREELLRIDYRLTDNHSVYGRFIHDTLPADQPFGEVFGGNQAAFPGIASLDSNQPGRGFVGAWTWIVAPNKLNEFSYQYSHGAILSTLNGDYQRNVAIPKIYTGQPGDDILPGISFGGAGLYGGWNFFGPYDNTYGSHRFKDTFTWNTGAHALKFGVLLSWEFKNENAASGTNGAFFFPGTSDASFRSTGDAFADFLLGRASSYSENNIDIASRLRFQMYEAFVQDDWKVKPNLTINAGLRWSYIGQPYDTNDVLTNFDPAAFKSASAYQISSGNVRVKGTGDPLNGLIIAGQNSPYGRRVTNNPWANFGPRVGFSWDPKGDGRLAVRAGYGLYFDRTLVGIALQNAFVNPPFAFTAAVTATGGNGPTLGNPTAGAARDNEILVPNLIAMSPDFKIPMTHQWSAGMQRELPWSFTLDVAYVGSAGRNLLRAYDINQTPAGTLSPVNAARPYRGWGNITLRATDATSIYNALQTSLSRRFKNGVQVNFNYTLSKVMTDSPSDRSDVAQNLNDLAAERAVASYDRTHMFGANYVIELPFYRDESNRLKWNLLGGWQISGYTRYESGVPLTITQSANTMNSTGNIQRRPDLIGDSVGPKTVEQWFNTAAFSLPAANTFGNSPRAVVRGPYRHLTDLALFKNFIVTDRVRLQYRLEAFNVFNHTNFTGVGTVFASTTFGRLTAAAEPRLIQMGLKVTF